MFLSKNYNKITGKTRLSILHSYRDINGNVKKKVMLNIGDLNTVHDRFPDIIGDPIEYFENLAKQMTFDYKENTETTIKLNFNELLNSDIQYSYNFGSLIPSSVFHELELHELFTHRNKYTNISAFLPNKVIQLLVYNRILEPASKLGVYNTKNKYFDIEADKNHIIELQHIYRTLDFLAPLKSDVISWLNNKIHALYPRDTSIILYDVTNYYFESDSITDLRNKGFSKENKKTPIIQMGLAIDRNGIPITYELFSGNTHDCKTFDDILSNLKKEYNNDSKIIIVADKGLNSGDNIAESIIKGNGYIFGQSIKKLPENELKRVFNGKYNHFYDKNGKLTHSMRSEIVSKVIQVSTTHQKSKKKVEIEQKQITYYSVKYANMQKKKREAKINKAYQIIANPSLYDKQCDQGAYGYVLNAEIDSETGEIKPQKNKKLVLDIKKIKEEQKCDGYYMIVTSELKMNENEIIKAYHDLWKIEDTFKITKSDLELRPFNHRTDERVRGHFLMCYISLVILRILHHKLENEYSCAKIISELNQIKATYVKENIYQLSHRSEVTDKFDDVFETNFKNKWITKSDINKNFSKLRK